MGMFESTRFVPVALQDLTPVATEVMAHFRQQGYEVIGQKTASGGWEISLTKGGVFKSLLGLKTALKIYLEPSASLTLVRTKVGLFGTQALPTTIAFLAFWPVLIPQVWGLVRQSKLDQEAIDCVEASLKAHAQVA
ncbi:hypothetical protein JCM13664_09180 [Methylothermus subterraneus]